MCEICAENDDLGRSYPVICQFEGKISYKNEFLKFTILEILNFHRYLMLIKCEPVFDEIRWMIL